MLSDESVPMTTHQPHRLLLIAPSPPPYGGMAIQARLLEKLLRQEGIEVEFFPSNLPFPAWLRGFERVPCVRTVIRSALIALRLWGAVRRAEVVHVLAASWVYFFAVAYPAVIYSRLQGKRVVLNYRAGDAARFFRQFGWAVKPIVKMASEVTAPSDFLARVMRDTFHVPVGIVRNILDSSVFRYRKRTAIRPSLLVTRHLELIYDVETGLKAFRKVQEHYPEASLWIAGTGSQEQRLRELADGWNLKNVHFLGHVAHTDLPAVYEQCDILLNSSRVDNFPGALLEASGAGLVVVSTCAGGIPFMYQNGKSALLVEPGDWEGLARSVELVLQTPGLGESLAAEAVTLVRECDWKEVRRALYKAYGFSEAAGAAPSQPLTVSTV